MNLRLCLLLCFSAYINLAHAQIENYFSNVFLQPSATDTALRLENRINTIAQRTFYSDSLGKLWMEQMEHWSAYRPLVSQYVSACITAHSTNAELKEKNNLYHILDSTPDSVWVKDVLAQKLWSQSPLAQRSVRLWLEHEKKYTTLLTLASHYSTPYALEWKLRANLTDSLEKEIELFGQNSADKAWYYYLHCLIAQQKKATRKLASLYADSAFISCVSEKNADVWLKLLKHANENGWPNKVNDWLNQGHQLVASDPAYFYASTSAWMNEPLFETYPTADSIRQSHFSELAKNNQNDWKLLCSLPDKTLAIEKTTPANPVLDWWMILIPAGLCFLFVALWIGTLIKKTRLRKLLAETQEQREEIQKEAEKGHQKIREQKQRIQLLEQSFLDSEKRFHSDLQQKTTIGLLMHNQVLPHLQKMKSDVETLGREGGNALPVQAYLAVQNAVMKAFHEARKAAEYMVPEKVIAQPIAGALAALCEAYSSEKDKITFALAGEPTFLPIEKSTFLYESAEWMMEQVQTQENTSMRQLGLSFWPEGVVLTFDYNRMANASEQPLPISLLRTGALYFNGKCEWKEVAKGVERVTVQLPLSAKK